MGLRIAEELHEDDDEAPSGNAKRAIHTLGYAFKNARESENMVAGKLRPELFVERFGHVVLHLQGETPALVSPVNCGFECAGAMWSSEARNLYMSAE